MFQTEEYFHAAPGVIWSYCNLVSRCRFRNVGFTELIVPTYWLISFSAIARLDAADAKSEPNLNALGIIRLVDLICHLWQQYINAALLPLASSSVTTRREMVLFNNQTVSRLETGTNNLLQRVTDCMFASFTFYIPVPWCLITAIINWLSVQLSKQKRNDFKPRNDDLSFARVNTEPCVSCCDLLEKIRDAATQNLSGKNLEVFLTEIGVAFHRYLFDHQFRMGSVLSFMTACYSNISGNSPLALLED